MSKPEEPIDEDLDEPDEDLDEPDEVANAEEDEIEDEEPITESAAAWLGRPPKEQNALRKRKIKILLCISCPIVNSRCF